MKKIEKPNVFLRKNNVNPDFKLSGYGGTILELLTEYRDLLNQGQELPIQIVSEPLLSRDKFIELAKIVEIHMQKCPEYRYMIRSGGFTERFNDAYKKYLDKNAR